MVVENCHSHGHAGLGLHPGSGSQRPLIKNNRLEDNDIGIFFCWGVKYGLAEGNRIRNCRLGVSIGHRDTDNLVIGNDIRDSGLAGVLFRPERGPGFCGHRNQIEGNRIVNSGGETGIAVDIQGGTESITLKGNEIRELRDPKNRVGIRLGKDTKDITLADNRIEGVKLALDDQRGGD
jgi:nitrous oxidase accessory protein NosD